MMHWNSMLASYGLIFCHANHGLSSFASTSTSTLTLPSRRTPTSMALLSSPSDLSLRARGGEDDEPSVLVVDDETENPDTEFLKSVIRSSNFGSGLESESAVLHGVVKSFEKVEYEMGSQLFSEQDETADFLFVVESGQCAVSLDGKQLPLPYGIASHGTIVGEKALLYDIPRVCTVIAKTKVTGFRLDRAAFQLLLSQLPKRQEDLRRELKQIDDIIDKVSGAKTKYEGDVIRKFHPARKWLWKRWTGTILQHAWKVSVANLSISITVALAIRYIAHPSWGFGTLPDPSDELIARMLGLFKAWEYLMTVTTFTLTFFLGQAYKLWKDIYTTARVVQGRLSDINLVLAVSAERDKSGAYTKRAKDLMEDVASYTRLYHVFMWASFSSKLRLLLSDVGLRRMVSKGILTHKQYNTLQKLDASTVAAPQNACLMWIMTRFLKGMEDSVVPNDKVMKQTLFDKSMELQGTFAAVGGKLAGKIPLAYAHFVQIQVDSFLLLAPFALYAKLGVWSIPAVGVLTLFFSGLLDLSKILLHPLGNDDDTYDDSVNMDLAVIIQESNGGSMRWMDGGKVLPF